MTEHAAFFIYSLNSRESLAHQLAGTVNLDTEWVGLDALRQVQPSTAVKGDVPAGVGSGDSGDDDR